ncbi:MULTISPECIES: MFS transporter [unclassified Microbacterium]|uniref:MFS transporter n=1 Tax=unclassified Microbacterium TaxID=2609290 RepID=UPI0016051E0B|nr:MULTISPECIES: MFS transporter [unclassified Microbacterium]QNA91955.1 MFS transporter [Microbacterium sp. Se63.02b]QYM65184.1 MFS transporter [Microbacterium sp. Se5.02b]
MSATTKYEDIPLNKFHVRVAIAGSGGQFSDGFVLGIVGIVLASAKDDLQLTPLLIGMLGAATLGGLFLGALITGPVADRMGRSKIFRFDMLFIALCSLSQFFVQEAWQLLVIRLIIGLLLGADYVVSKTLVTEHAPRHFRGRLLSLLAVAWAAGYVFAYLAGFLLSSLGDEPWRYMLIASAIPELLVFAVRLGVPESPLWLVRHGKVSQAAAIVRRVAGPNVEPPPVTAAVSTVRTQSRYTELFSPIYRRRTIVGIVFYVCQVIPYFALGTFSPLVMSSLGVTNSLAAGALYNVFLLTGAILGLVVVDRLSRRSFLISTFFTGAVFLAALVLLAPLSPIIAVILFASFALILAAAANLEFIYPPELFPTEVRGSGMGLVTAGSRLGSATSTFLLPIVVAGAGINTALFACVGVLLIGGIVCWLWAPETRRESFVAMDATADAGIGLPGDSTALAEEPKGSSEPIMRNQTR